MALGVVSGGKPERCLAEVTHLVDQALALCVFLDCGLGRVEVHEPLAAKAGQEQPSKATRHLSQLVLLNV